MIIGGGLGVRFGDALMEPLTKEMGKHLFVDERPPAVRVASLGDLGGAIGASLLSRATPESSPAIPFRTERGGGD